MISEPQQVEKENAQKEVEEVAEPDGADPEEQGAESIDRSALDRP